MATLLFCTQSKMTEGLKPPRRAGSCSIIYKVLMLWQNKQTNKQTKKTKERKQHKRKQTQFKMITVSTLYCLVRECLFLYIFTL